MDDVRTDFFDLLAEQINPEAFQEEDENDKPVEETRNEDELFNINHDPNNNRQYGLYTFPKEHLRQQAEQEEKEQEEEEIPVKKKHPDELFKTKLEQMSNLKLKVVVEYFFLLRKENKALTAQIFARWLTEYADEYNLKQTSLDDEFQTTITEDATRKKITKFLEIRTKMKKSLLDVDSYKKVSLDVKVFKESY